MTATHAALDRHHHCPFRSASVVAAVPAEPGWRPTLRHWPEAEALIVPHGALLRAIGRLLRRLRRS